MYVDCETTLPKQKFLVVFRNRCFYEFRNIHRKAIVLESFFNKVAGLKDCNFISKRLQNSCFPKSLAKFLTTAFLHNTSGGCFCTLGTTALENIVKRNGKKRSQNTFSYNFLGSPAQADYNS